MGAGILLGYRPQTWCTRGEAQLLGQAKTLGFQPNVRRPSLRSGRQVLRGRDEAAAVKRLMSFFM